MKNIAFFLAVIGLVATATWFNFNDRISPIVQGLDLRGGVRVVVQIASDWAPPTPPEGEARRTRSEVRDVARSTLERRVNNLGLAGATVRPRADDQIEIQMPGLYDPDAVEVQNLIQTAQLEFRHFKDVWERETNPLGRLTMIRGVGEDGRETYRFEDRRTGDEVPLAEVIAGSDLIVSGEDLLPNASQDIDMNGNVVVNFEFTGEAARTFGNFTTRNVGQYLAIILDDQVISAPVIRSPITEGRGIIEGGFDTVYEARELAVLLNAGALPAPLEVVERQGVGATLGAEAVRASIIAALAGLALVLLFMLGYYLLPGLLACLALLFYASLSFAIYKGLGVTLDLAAITGFILSVGMAVDANILIFERLKEEIRSGKTLHAAIDSGFSRAFSAILDSNVTTWIVCFILFRLGAPMIQGFALTLAIGVAVSMFTAITISRTMLHLVVHWRALRQERFFGLNVGWLPRRFRLGEAQLDIMRHRRPLLIFAGVIVAAALVTLGAGGQRLLGIDFTGGYQIQLTYREQVDDATLRADVEEVLAQHGVGPGEAQIVLGTNPVTWTDVTASGARTEETDLEALEAAVNELHPERLDLQPTEESVALTARFAVGQHEREDWLALLRGANLSEANVEISTQREGNLPMVFVLMQEEAAEDEVMTAIFRDLRALPHGSIDTASAQTMIGAAIAKELKLGALWSVLLASLAIILFLGMRFAIGGFVTGLKFGGAAVATLVHDIFFAAGLFTLVGTLRGWQIDSYFVTAALTVIGYSVNDTIVVFDRIRENLRNRLPRESLEDLVNRSVTQNIDRSVNTTLTVLLVLGVLMAFGGATIKPFATALFFGIGIGAYSSIFLASPLVVMWERASQRAAAERRRRDDVRPQSGRPDRSELRRSQPKAKAKAKATTDAPPVREDGPVPVREGTVAAPSGRKSDGEATRGRGGSTIRPKKKRRS